MPGVMVWQGVVAAYRRAFLESISGDGWGDI